MAHMWKVGDKAVCIKEGEWLGRISRRKHIGKCPSYMEIVRVDGIDIAHDGVHCLALSGYVDTTSTGKRITYRADRFRPIVKADDYFIAQMRSLKPKVKQ